MCKKLYTSSLNKHAVYQCNSKIGGKKLNSKDRGPRNNHRIYIAHSNLYHYRPVNESCRVNLLITVNNNKRFSNGAWLTNRYNRYRCRTWNTRVPEMLPTLSNCLHYMKYKHQDPGVVHIKLFESEIKFMLKLQIG